VKPSIVFCCAKKDDLRNILVHEGTSKHSISVSYLKSEAAVANIAPSAFSGLRVDHPTARTMHEMLVWIGPRGGLFVMANSRNGTRRKQYLNHLQRGQVEGRPALLSENGRRGLIRVNISGQ
jgi:hypothetical protein